MKKIFLSLIIAFNILNVQAGEWYGFIPVRITEGIPYFLLRTLSSENVSKQQIFPPLGNYLPQNQKKIDFLKDQVQSLRTLSSDRDLKVFFEKLPYLFYQAQSTEKSQQSCFRFWWPSSFFQTHKLRTASSPLTNSHSANIDFFGFPINQPETEDTPLISSYSKYKIYFVPLENLPRNTFLHDKTQWFSIEEIAVASEQIPSAFLEKLTAMFTMIDQGSDQKWEITKHTLRQDAIHHLKRFPSK